MMGRDRLGLCGGRRGRAIAGTSLTVVWAAASGASGQPAGAAAGGAGGGARAGQPAALQKVEPGAADLGPLSNSLRSLEGDLRVPTGYEGVYRLEMQNIFGWGGGWGNSWGGAGNPGEAMFMRIDGGLTAVFPRSQYVETKAGVMPAVPAGTVYYLGKLPASMTTPAKPAAKPASWLDLSAAADDARRAVEAEALTQQAAERAKELSPEVSVWNDEGFRQRRLGQLLGKLDADRVGRR